MPKDGKDEMLVVRIAASKKEDDVGGRKNLPFASRRGRVRSTQGMHELHRSNTPKNNNHPLSRSAGEG